MQSDHITIIGEFAFLSGQWWENDYATGVWWHVCGTWDAFKQGRKE